MKNDEILVNVKHASLEEMLFCVGGTIFSGSTTLRDINSDVLKKLSELIQDEIAIRNQSKNRREELFIVINSISSGNYND
tara:strand:+ start:835 stop:1074 length:240 start_codon:yes stop_codon:yes gene_type:complete